MQVMFLVCGSIRMMIKDPSSTHNLGGGSNKAKVLSRWWFQIFFIFTPIWGMIQFDEHIFQMGWFNHQPVVILLGFPFMNGVFW